MVDCLGICNYENGFCRGCGQDLSEIFPAAADAHAEKEEASLHPTMLPGSEDAAALSL